MVLFGRKAVSSAGSGGMLRRAEMAVGYRGEQGSFQRGGKRK